MTDYAVQIKVKNGPLLRAMRQAGYETAAAFSRACGVEQSTIGTYLNLRHAALTKTGEWRPAVLKMANTLRMMPEDLFPPQHLERGLDKNSGEVHLSLADMADLGLIQSQDEPDELMAKQERRIAIARTMNEVLTEQQRLCLDLRLGLSGDEPLTQDETGKRLDVSRERVRQIEAVALQKLRHACTWGSASKSMEYELVHRTRDKERRRRAEEDARLEKTRKQVAIEAAERRKEIDQWRADMHAQYEADRAARARNEFSAETVSALVRLATQGASGQH